MNFEIFDSLNAGVLVLKDKESVVYVNDFLLDTLGLSRRRTLLKPLSENQLIDGMLHEPLKLLSETGEPTPYSEVEVGEGEGSFQISCQSLGQGLQIVYFIEVGLEKKIHRKFQGALQQKESALQELSKTNNTLNEYLSHMRFFAFVAIYLSLGVTPYAVKYMVKFLPPMFTMGFISILAGMVSAVYLYPKSFSRGLFPTIKTSMISGFLVTFLRNGALAWSLYHIEPYLASASVACMPIVMHAIMVARKKEVISGRLLAGLILGALGVVGIVFREINWGQVELANFGFPLLLCSYVFSTFGSSLRINSPQPLLNLPIEMLFGGMSLVVVGLVYEDLQFVNVLQRDPFLIISLLYLLFVTSLVTNFSFTWLAGQATATKSASSSYFSAIIGVGIGMIFGEVISLYTFVMIFLVVLSGLFIPDHSGSKSELAT